MIGDPSELAAAFEGTVLGGRSVEVFDIPLHDMAAFAVAIAPDEVGAGWTVARGLLEISGRWPVATTSWNLGPLDPAELFSRFPFETSSQHDTAPSAVLARAEAVDVAEHIAERLAVLREEEPVDEWIDHEVGETYAKFGVAPSLEARYGMRSPTKSCRAGSTSIGGSSDGSSPTSRNPSRCNRLTSSIRTGTNLQVSSRPSCFSRRHARGRLSAS